VEIDYCPQCRGVWLDRGELDKIIKRTIEVASPRRRGETERFAQEDWDEERRPKGKHRRDSWLGELFDFG
jgi:Zn-finger nucleic acid-binding protein